ncbi:penicillin-binding protein [Desulfonema ishimotonii]|uniref:Penicillin-binding protein 1A n=2 Tax=Desulfonema ishimotonii TaxID=45657 RepID=A0A401G1B2_9BACT|nr:penicillin-binding protein [Desulfonema ishimotonii]
MLRGVVVLTLLALIGIGAAVAAAVGVYKHYSQDLPPISSLTDYEPAVITTVYSDDNRKIAEFYEERRIVLPYSEIPEMLVRAFISAEDSRFFEHEGVDIKSIIRAALKNFEAGTVVQGGSTITQQVTKSFLLTPEKKFSRKIKEAILAYRIDKKLTKEQILHLYLNQIYLGHGAYGVEAAAENYFGKPVKELTLAECAVLAGLPQAPSRYSPFKHPEFARDRQKYVLNRMVIGGYITREQADEAFSAPLNLRPKHNWYIEKVPYYTEYVRQYVEKKYGREMLYRGGLTIHTAVSIDLQTAARQAVGRGLRDLDKRHSGFRGPLRHLEPEAVEGFSKALRQVRHNTPPEKGDIVSGIVAGVDQKTGAVTVRLGDGEGIMPFREMRWGVRQEKDVAALLSPGDVIEVALKEKAASGKWHLALEQPSQAQSALLCLETGTAHVKAMVGGKDFKSSQFNRAIQSRRQPGSAFKPVIYAAALDKGYTPATELMDNVFIYQDARMKWKPKNYDRKFYGPTLLRKALAKSRNLPTINILDDIGVDYTIDYARRLGIRSDLSRDLSIALGSSGVSLLDMVSAYAVFADGGNRMEPIFITKITDRNGNVLEEAVPHPERAIDETTAYLMTSLLESVVKEGTARKVRALQRPAAGKTGTTNNLHDAWFVGYTPDYIAGAWVGYDQERSLGRRESGGKAALPIWLDFMKKAHEGKAVRAFPVPRGIVFSKIDAATGLLPVPETERTIFECFREGNVPTRYSRRSDTVTESDQFFKTGL